MSNEADIEHAVDRVEEVQKAAAAEISSPSKEIVVAQAAPVPAPQRERLIVDSYLPVLDTAKFEQMWRIAKVMDAGQFLPFSICRVDGKEKGDLLPETVVQARAFKIVNFAVLNNVDPFSAAECASFVHGRLCWEGKFIASLIEARLGIRLKYEWDDKTGDALGITISGKYADEDFVREVKGTVAQWKTTGTGSPWGSAPGARKQLAYRGAREWARLHSPGIMTGVMAPDEVDFLVEQRHEPLVEVEKPRERALKRLQAAKAKEPEPASTGANGFSETHVASEMEQPKEDAPAAEASGEPVEGDAVDEDAEAARLNADGAGDAPPEQEKPTRARAAKATPEKVVEVMPKTAAEYETYLDRWLASEPTKVAILTRWRDERVMRGELGVEIDDARTEKVKKAADAKK